jgi:tetratricopeptide (TPR) repeat protein
VIDAGGEIAGALLGADQKKLLIIAENLRRQGLIYTYQKGDSLIYTAHPFLREYFRNLLSVKPEDIHEAVRNELAAGLDTKPANKPMETEILDKYEVLIEHSILAGHYQEAHDLFFNVMSGSAGSDHLYHTLGDYGRIMRIISLFSDDGTPQCFTSQLSDSDKSYLINTWGLAAYAQGDLKSADSCFNLASELYRKNKDWQYLAAGLQNSAWIAMEHGFFPSAKKLLEESLKYIDAEDANNEYVKLIKRYDNGYLASTFHALGEISRAKQHFLKATEISGEPLYSIAGICEVEHLLALGDKVNSFKRTEEILTNCKIKGEHDGEGRDISLCHYLLGLLSLPDSVSQAREHLQKLRDWTEKSGHMECIIRSHILASEIAYCSGDYPTALFEATTGLNHAESCGYGQFAIDLLLLIAKIQLAIPDYRAALGYARNALDRSQHPDCRYAWGEANGLHLCGVCHQALGEYDLARLRLEAALEVRERIQHPGTDETRKLLEKLLLRQG